MMFISAKRSSLLWISAFAFAFFALSFSLADAASLYFSPASGTYKQGRVFSVGVYVNSAEDAMNAAGAEINYPTNLLEVVSLSKSDSIMSLWAEEPNFSNSAGKVTFAGVALNPGFRGTGGKILTVNFRVRSTGSARLDFVNTEVLANDGKGTNILDSVSGALFTLVPDVSGPTVKAPIEALEPPVITSYPKELQSGEPLIVKGQSYPNSQVIFWLEKEKEGGKSFNLKTDGDGKFVFLAEERLGDGLYQIWAQAVDKQGEKSDESERLSVLVRPPAFIRIGSQFVTFLAVFVPLLALIILLILLVYYAWRKYQEFKRRLKKEIHEAEETLHTEFDKLHRELKEQVKYIEAAKTRRELTDEEARILVELKKHIDNIEKTIRKEVEDIEKEVE